MADKYVNLSDIIETLEHEWGYEGMREDLEKLPTADVVEIVRCKDCKYWKQVTAERHACCVFGFEMDCDEYCSYGERKE